MKVGGWSNLLKITKDNWFHSVGLVNMKQKTKLRLVPEPVKQPQASHDFTSLNSIWYWMFQPISCRVLPLKSMYCCNISAKDEMFPPSPLILRLLDIT